MVDRNNGKKLTLGIAPSVPQPIVEKRFNEEGYQQ